MIKLPKRPFIPVKTTETDRYIARNVQKYVYEKLGIRMIKPSREFDALVAEKVMRLEVKSYESLKGADIREKFGTFWTPIRDNNYGTPYQQWQPVQPYSTDIAAAWEVVEVIVNMRRQDFKLLYAKLPPPQNDRKGWRAIFTTGQGTREAIAPTVPHAICLAALKACGVEVE